MLRFPIARLCVNLTGNVKARLHLHIEYFSAARDATQPSVCCISETEVMPYTVQFVLYWYTRGIDAEVRFGAHGLLRGINWRTGLKRASQANASVMLLLSWRAANTGQCWTTCCAKTPYGYALCHARSQHPKAKISNAELPPSCYTSRAARRTRRLAEVIMRQTV